MAFRQDSFDQRGGGTPGFFPQKLAVLASQKVSTMKRREAQERGLALGISERLNRLDALLVGYIFLAHGAFKAIKYLPLFHDRQAPG